MVPKKKLLVLGLPRVLREGYLTLFRELSEDFEIVIVSVDYFTPRGFIENMTVLKKEGVIRKFFLLPPYNSVIKMLRMLRSITSQLKECQFDVFLAESATQFSDRYLVEWIIPKTCVRIALWPGLTFLLGRNESLVRGLLSKNSATTEEPKLSTLSGWINKVCHAGTIICFFKKTWSYSNIKRRQFVRLFVDSIWVRRILAKLLLGKTFPREEYDRLTQLDSGKRFQHYIFCDEIEASAHKALFKIPMIYVAQHPNMGVCRCGSSSEKKSTILSPLSGFINQNNIAEQYLSLFYRDFKTVLEQSGAKSIHLRIHPDETKRWYISLRDYLAVRGMDVTVVDCDKPIGEVVCNYLGMAGDSSCALRDGRAACQQAFIVGFEAVSKFAQKNPKFHFGNSEGIGWINEDGSYDPSIFKRNVYIPPPRKRVAELIREFTHHTNT